MPDQKRLTIVLRKDVPDLTTANTLVNIVKAKLADHPDIQVTASYSQTLNEEPPSP